jgi:hypothetical protein
VHSFAGLGSRPFARGLVPGQVPFDILLKGCRFAAQGLAVMLDDDQLLVGELQVARLGLNGIMFFFI